MKIPEKVKVGGINYTIVLVDGLHNDNAEVCAGRHSPSTDTIELNSEYPHDRMCEVLWHEILHAVEARLGIDLEEGMLCAISSHLYQVVKDNETTMFGETDEEPNS